MKRGRLIFIVFITLLFHKTIFGQDINSGKVISDKTFDNYIFKIPTIDISSEEWRHVIVAEGTKEIYQGHADTELLSDGTTMLCVWVINHAGYLGPLARSEDGGKTWSGRIEVPDSWGKITHTTPCVHELTDPNGVKRLFIYGGSDNNGRLRQSYSEDGGKTWTEMYDTGLAAECPPKSIISFDNNTKLMMWCDYRDIFSSPDRKNQGSAVWQSSSYDGGLSWTPEKVVVKVPTQWAQPTVIRNKEDEKQLLMLMRYSGNGNSIYSVSYDGANTWSEAKQLPLELTGHRPKILYAPDGRLVVVMRDMASYYDEGIMKNPTKGHYVAWVGTYDDILNGRPGQYRIKLLHSYDSGFDCGYSGFELLPDGTFVATTYIKYWNDNRKQSIVSTRFKLEELDKYLKLQSQKK